MDKEDIKYINFSFSLLLISKSNESIIKELTSKLTITVIITEELEFPLDTVHCQDKNKNNMQLVLVKH